MCVGFSKCVCLFFLTYIWWFFGSLLLCWIDFRFIGNFFSNSPVFLCSLNIDFFLLSHAFQGDRQTSTMNLLSFGRLYAARKLYLLIWVVLIIQRLMVLNGFLVCLAFMFVIVIINFPNYFWLMGLNMRCYWGHLG